MAEAWTAVLARLGTPTGDGRILVPGGITNRDLPLPLMWQRKTEDGHGGAVIVGRIEEMNYLADMVTATGTLFESAETGEVRTLIEGGVVGPSVDLDDIDYVMDDSDRVIVTQGRVAGATLVPIPAFADVSITLADAAEPGESETGGTTDDEASDDLTPLLASAAPLPPLEWFANPKLSGPTPLTVTDDGRVFGHIATWGTCHVGLPGCVTAPSSQTEYAYFLTGAEKTADGATVPVGKLTVGGGHADPNAGFVAAAEHYDDTASAVASVFAGEDEHGIWVAGRVIPGTSDEKVSELQRSPISGDWRRIGGSLELIAAHGVNVPGFPVPRAKVKFSLGEQRSLIAHFKVVPAPAPEPDVEPEPDKTLAAKARWAWTKEQI